MRVQEIDTVDLAKLEKEFRLFPKIPHEKAKALLEKNFKDEDLNSWIRGSSGISNIPESVLLKKESNERFNYLVKLQSDIEKAFMGLPKELQDLVRLYFWGEYSYFGWKDIAVKEHISRTKAYEMRYKILENLAEFRGSV